MSAPTTRRLIVMRHAKSAWPDVADFDRPLAPRGLRDAPEAGRRLRAAGWVPDHVVCSPARRTRETWRLVSRELSGAAGEPGADLPVSYDERVYDASMTALLYVVCETPAATRTLMLLGHNPGMHELALTLAGEAVGDAFDRTRQAFPTSAIALLTIPGPWSGLTPGSALLDDLIIPRG
jgi:phosphohistidine phosphatase